QGGAPIVARDLTWQGADFVQGQTKGPLAKDAGLVLVLPATAVYTSPVVLAPVPFSDLGSVWEADLPPGTSLLLEVRTSPDAQGERWTSWQVIEEEDDAPAMPYGLHAGKLLFVPQRDGVHRRLQFRFSFSSSQAGARPTLRKLTFTFIDARAGPSTHAIMEKLGPAPKSVGLDQPRIIRRVEWGCPDGEQSPGWPAEYAPVTHVIVHHTVTPNDDVDWAARVRAIWYYHTYTRGWGDIGYNYLIDPLGNIYEGRAGGADVVGGHAREYNRGTMGVACIGTYARAQPPAALEDSLVALLSWKAAERGIDPLGEGFNGHKIYPNIAGHRDVGQTACPGDALYARLPAIREAVQARLQAQEEGIIVEEQDPGFRRSDAFWHDGCGRQGHSWWTHTVTNPALSTNWATWRPELPRSGWYEVLIYVPSCSSGEWPESTSDARYRIYYQGGGTLVSVDQRAQRGRWVSLGTYPFARGTSGYVYLDDLAGDQWRALWYDAVAWVLRVPLEEPLPTPIGLLPQDGAWLNHREITLTWGVSPLARVDGFHLVVATDADLRSRLVDGNVDGSEFHLALARDYPALYWTVRAQQGNRYGPFAPTQRFGVDSTPPWVRVLAFYRTSRGLLLQWAGGDVGSGLEGYAVQARDGPGSEWWDLGVDPSATGVTLDVPVGVVREFRILARDRAGNVAEAPGGGNGLSSAAAAGLGRVGYLPIVLLRPSRPLSTAVPSPAAPTPLPERTAAPDLVVVSVRSSQSSPFDCDRPTGIVVEVQNVGTAVAGRFYLALVGEGLEECRWLSPGLLPGQSAEYVCPTVVLNRSVRAVVDPEGMVAETNEENNVLDAWVSVLLLPPCTPAP
ncbi:MAG: N-acetylmuramoyl-L-alanine amidase, partial [Chloroflexia bacterium]